MFDQIPNRRITERRQAFKDALIAAISLAAGGTEAIRKGHIDWETWMWAIVFILSVAGYWKRRHEEPWNPPDVDGKKRHYGALERQARDWFHCTLRTATPETNASVATDFLIAKG